MHPRESWSAVIGGRRYRVSTATLIASDEYWDGHNWERRGTNTFLYRTPKGGYFTAFLTMWEGARDSLEPISEAEARNLWDALPEKHCSFETAFPDVEVVDA